MPIFHSPGGPVEINRCPLKPDKRHFGYAHRCQDNRSAWPRQRWLIWREPAGWVLAFGDPHFCKLRRTALPSWEQAMAWQAELVRRERRMHCLAGLVRGRADTCTGKVDHLSGLAAEDYVRHAPVLPVEPYLRAEPYPCVWCNGWHVDRALEAGERAFYGGLGVVWQVRDVARQELWETAEPERRELLHRLMTLAMLVIGRHVPGFPLEEWLAFV